MSRFERPNIAAMTGYSSGEQPVDADVIKLNTNENPFPPTPAVQAVLSAFTADSLRRYPPATAEAFRETAAALHQVGPGNIIATRGGDELLRLVITTFVEPGSPIGMTDPTYSLYPVLAAIQDCPCVQVPLTESWQLPTDFAEQINTAGCKLTFIVNPHAPSGTCLPVAELAEIAAQLDGILVVDEAYIDFADGEDNAIPLAATLDNVIVLRTLSKGYSLAGLRFGYGVGAAELIAPMLGKTRDSYNLDALSQQIAAAALADQDYARTTWQAVREQRAIVTAALQRHGFAVEPSQTNFLLVTVPGDDNSAEKLYLALKARGILVRHFPTERLADKLRISIGTAAENTRLLAAIESLIPITD